MPPNDSMCPDGQYISHVTPTGTAICEAPKPGMAESWWRANELEIVICCSILAFALLCRLIEAAVRRMRK